MDEIASVVDLSLFEDVLLQFPVPASPLFWNFAPRLKGSVMSNNP
jgi:hypothetical protein